MSIKSKASSRSTIPNKRHSNSDVKQEPSVIKRLRASLAELDSDDSELHSLFSFSQFNKGPTQANFDHISRKASEEVPFSNNLVTC
jgi:hypothetical protein